MAPPRLSVIVCSYNDAAYLRGALTAICTQSRPADEVIVVDDGSTDETPEVIAELVARWGNLRPFRNVANRGVGASVLRALDAATGDWLAFSAADDRVLPGLYETVDRLARAHPEAGVIAGGAMIAAEGEAAPGRVEPLGLAPVEGALDPAALLAAMRRRYLWIPTSSAFVRRAAMASCGGWCVELEWLTDWFLFHHAALRFGLAYRDEPASVIRQRADFFGTVGAADRAAHAAVLDRLIALLADPAHADFRQAMRRAPLLGLTPLGLPFVRRLALHPGMWDLAAALIAKKLALSGGARLRRRVRVPGR